MKEEIVRKAALSVAETESGQTLLRALCAECGFHLADLCVNRATGTVDPVATTLNVERRRVYIWLRNFLTPELRQKIEFTAPAAAEEAKTINKEEK